MSGTRYALQNATTDGAGEEIILNYDAGILAQAFGTWGGATVVVQTIAPDNTTWLALPDLTGSAVTITADTQFTITDFVKGQKFRAVVSGSSGTTDINLTIQDI